MPYTGGQGSIAHVDHNHPTDLAREIRSLADKTNDLTAMIVDLLDLVQVYLVDAPPLPELLEPLIADLDPNAPPNPILAAYNLTRDLQDAARESAQAERDGSEIWERLGRMADLLELATL